MKKLKAITLITEA